ncbi:MAG: amino acid permease, partial [Actinobacteria bacterium]|nr:amino acid permease [Actinomycetota bacterium]
FKGRRPKDQADNAAITLAMLGAIAITMLVGITFLANRVHAKPSDQISVVAQVAKAVFGGGFMFGFVQIATALILVLAANTAYQDFPRLSSILARDRFLPRQFINRGDRLVFSNGVIVLATIAAILIVVTHASVTTLIQMYVVGVFTSFTLSQAGMVRRWRRLQPPGWKRNAILNGIGATTTGIVLIVITYTKFNFPKIGAWIVILTVALMVLLFRTIKRHYKEVAQQLRLPEDRPRRAAGTRAVVLVARIDDVTMRAVGYARAMRPVEIRALHVGRGDDAELVRRSWEERRLSIRLDVVPGDKSDLVDQIRAYVRALDVPEDEYVTLIVPEIFERTGMRQFLRSRRVLLLKTAMLFERRVVLTNIPVRAEENRPESRRVVHPTRVIGVVLVSAVHNATLRALEYARALNPTDLRAVTFNVEPDETARVLETWGREVVDIALEAIDSPYREVTRPLLRYVRAIRQRNPDALVNVIVPEFVVRKLWHQALHNQSAVGIKQTLLFEGGVVVTNVPFHLD